MPMPEHVKRKPSHPIQIRTNRGLEVVEFELLHRNMRTQRVSTKKVRRMVWDHMTKGRVLKLLREAYDAGEHAGALNPYC